MTGVAEGAHAFRRSAGIEGLAERVRPFVVPAAALTSLFLGLAFLLFPLPRIGMVLPFVLLAIGLAGLGGSFSLPRKADTDELVTRTLGTSFGPLPSNSPRSFATVARGPPMEMDHLRAALTGAGSDWRILSAPADPGDETWLSWLPRERRRLGADNGGLLPGVVASPGRAGNLVAFPVRDYYGAVPVPAGAPHRPAPPLLVKVRTASPGGGRPLETAVVPANPMARPRCTSEGGGPYSEDELDRMFPPAAGRTSVFLDQAPDRVGGPSPWATGPAGQKLLPEADAERTEPPERKSDVAARPDEPDRGGLEPAVKPSGLAFSSEDGTERKERSDPCSSDLRLEAENPIPPHLRSAGPLIRTDAGATPREGKGRANSRSVCASCSKVVVNLRMSGPCPRCLRPVCSDCLRESFVSEGRGWCLDCQATVPSAS